MSKTVLFSSIIVVSLLIGGFSNTNSFADPINFQNEITPINNLLELKNQLYK
jgi:hypothetical protein